MPSIEIKDPGPCLHDHGDAVIILKSGGRHGYLHTDGVWRASCVGPGGMSGYHATPHAAEVALEAWLAGLPQYSTRYGRGYPRGGKIVRDRKRYSALPASRK